MALHFGLTCHWQDAKHAMVNISTYHGPVQVQFKTAEELSHLTDLASDLLFNSNGIPPLMVEFIFIYF